MLTITFAKVRLSEQKTKLYFGFLELMEQREVILHGAHLETGLPQNLVGTTNLCNVMVRHAHAFHPSTLQQGDKPGHPVLHIHRVV